MGGERTHARANAILGGSFTDAGWRLAHAWLDRADRRFGRWLRRGPAAERRWVAVLDLAVARQADRRYLTEQILPALLSEQPKRVLFVGVRAYTASYARKFQDSRTEFWTCDIDPAAVAYGEPGRHATTDVRELTRAFPESFFDVVILNGVFGWGVDDPLGMEKTVGAISTVLSPGGALLIGWNHDRSPDPDMLRGIADGFEPQGFSGLPQRVAFTGVTHVYAWYRRKQAGDQSAT